MLASALGTWAQAVKCGEAHALPAALLPGQMSDPPQQRSDPLYRHAIYWIAGCAAVSHC